MFALIDSDLSSLQNYASDIAQNTSHSFWFDQLCLLGIFSAVAAICTVISIMMQEKLWPWTYSAMLYDTIRHLYRNRVCTLAMWAKYNYYHNQGKAKYFPAEEHYYKLKIPPEDIRANQYSMHIRPKTLEDIHNLEVLFRNYNVEIDVALMHIKDDTIDEETKQRDFQTLFFKTAYLAKKIVELRCSRKFAKKSKVLNKAFDKIETKYLRNQSENSDPRLHGMEFEKEIQAIYDIDRNRSNNFAAIFATEEQGEQYYTYLYDDVLIECGKNSIGEDKIHMIKKV
jgi:hypothetical protein